LAAHHTDPKIRDKALKYFIDKFNDKYKKEYISYMVNVAFLPCSDNTYARPLECFIDPECTLMKFRVLREDLQFQARQFGVRQCPSNEELKNKLIKNPPQEDKAKQIFEYLASRDGSFSWKLLVGIDFIPIRDKNRPNIIIFTNPRSCFFEDQEKRYHTLSTFQ